MYHEPGLPVFGSRIQQVEHVGYTLMLAERAGVHAAQVVKTGVGGADAAMLVTTPPAGRPLGALDPDAITDDTLAAVWSELEQLHAAGISHGNLDASASSSTDDGERRVRRLHVGRRDRRAVLARPRRRRRARRHRATRRATTARSPPRSRRSARSASARSSRSSSRRRSRRGPCEGRKHLGKTLKELRADLVTATGVEDAPPLKIKRLTLVNIGMLAGILLALGDRLPQHRGHRLGVGQEASSRTPTGAGPSSPRRCTRSSRWRGPPR